MTQNKKQAKTTKLPKPKQKQ